MRLGTNSSDEFWMTLNGKNQKIQAAYLQKIIGLTKTVNTKVMMGDSTVTEQRTFDPNRINDFFQRIARSLKDWSVQDVSVSNNEDIRRLFFKFERMVGNYLISGHMSVQFHVLLYYKPDHRVVDCQKELSEIVDLNKMKEQEVSDNSDQFILHKLKEIGYRDFDHQTLFETFYANDGFREELYREIEKNTDVDFQSISERKNKLFDELDSLLLETYQISPVLIDDSRLVTGEEGCLCTVDIEFVKNRAKQGVFDPKKISNDVRKGIVKSLDEIIAAINWH